MDTFASRLRQERLHHRLNQKNLADLGGVRPNAQVHYEKGSRLPKVDYLLAISSMVDVVYLITTQRMVEALTDLTIQEDVILATFRRMSEQDRECVSQLFMALNKRGGFGSVELE